MREDLIGFLSEKMMGFSKSQRLIGQYIVEHYNKAAYMTAAKLGETVGVSESTAVRFATELGFDGYPGLQKSLQEHIRKRLTSVERMEVTSDQLGSDDILTKVLHIDIEQIKKTLEETSTKDFESAVEAIIGAKKIYIMGVRSCSMLAKFFAYYLKYIFDDIEVIDTSTTSEMFEQIVKIDENDVLVAMSFPRYSKRTAQLAEYSKSRNAKIIAITDSPYSTIAKNATHLLIAKSDMASFVDSLVAPLSMINALIVAIGEKKKKEVHETFSRLEAIWDEYSVYEKSN